MRVLCAALALTACTSAPFDQLPNTIIDGSANVPVDGGDGGSDASDMGGLDGPALTLDLDSTPGGPTITIVTPVGVAPNLALVQGDVLAVTATIVSPDLTAIDASSVKLIIPSNNAAGFLSIDMVLQPQPNTYKGSIDISGIPTGPSEFSVVAADLKMRQTSLRQTYIHDRGPLISFIRPTAPTAKGSVNVEIHITDTLSPITTESQVVMTCGGRTVTLVGVAGSNPYILTGTINFNDYVPPLDGAQLITVEATNGNGTKGRATKGFTVDNIGPVITFVNPVEGQFIGGILAISVKISDISDVNDSSVVVAFGGVAPAAPFTVNLTRSTAGTGEFTGLFDVRQLGESYVSPVVSARAEDILGNQSNVGLEIIVDNTLPSLDLDPPRMRSFSVNGGECSNLMDPVGDDSVNDGDRIAQIVTVRARVEDNGNTAPGLLVERVSGIDKSSIDLFAIPATNAPLVVDTDGDGYCDDINPLLVPTSTVSASNEALAVSMKQIPANYVQDYQVGGTSAEWNCPIIGVTGSLPPAPLCTNAGTLMYSVLPTPYDLADSSIWTIPPVTQTPAGCVGFQLDTLNRLPEGPACLSISGRDVLGNHNAAAPLRICIDRGGGACATWSYAVAAALDCTGVYNKLTNTITAGQSCLPSVRHPVKPAPPPSTLCPGGKLFGSYCYVARATPKTFAAAETDCLSLRPTQNDSHVASVLTPRLHDLNNGFDFPRRTPNEMKLLHDILPGVTQWVGLSHSVNQGFTWTDSNFTPILIGACGAVTTSAVLWTDVTSTDCALTLPYVCKYPTSQIYQLQEVRQIN